MKSSIQIYEIQSGIYPLKVELYEIALVDPGGGGSYIWQKNVNCKNITKNYFKHQHFQYANPPPPLQKSRPPKSDPGPATVL